jgi:hypothetical protein
MSDRSSGDVVKNDDTMDNHVLEVGDVEKSLLVRGIAMMIIESDEIL